MKANSQQQVRLNQYRFQQRCFAEHWHECNSLVCMLRMLHRAPEFVNPSRFERYIDWLRQELITTRVGLLELRRSDFETLMIGSRESIESDLLANRIDGAEAERRGRLGALWTAHRCSDLVITTKVVEAGKDNPRGRKGHTDLAAIELTCREEYAAKFREIVGNPFVSES